MGELKQFLEAKRMNSEGTAKEYLTSVNYFLKCLGYYDKTGKERNIDELDKKASVYLNDIEQKERKNQDNGDPKRYKWNHVYNQLQKFVLWLNNEKNLASNTISTRVTGVKSFLAKSGIHLNNEIYQERVDMPKTRTISIDKKLSQKQLQDILSHAKIKGKALFTLLASSGIRISTAVSIELDELSLEQDPPRIYLHGGKTKLGRKRTIFFSNEAKQYIKEWIEHERERYLKRRERRMKNLDISPTDEEITRLFPMNRPNANKTWNRLLNKAGLDKRDSKTGRRLYHLHTLRKFFKSEAQKEIPKPIVEAMIGHKKGLDKAYSRYSEEELGEYYKKVEPAISIFTSPTELTKKVDSQTEKIQALEDRLNQRNGKIKELENKVEGMKETGITLAKTGEELGKASKKHKSFEDSLMKKLNDLTETVKQQQQEIEELKEEKREKGEEG